MNGKVTFIRIPKSASTSIYAFLGENNTIRNELLSANNNMYLNVFEPSHCSIADAEKYLGEGVLNAPVLAVVRNPYDRLLSMYFFAKKYDLASLYGIDMTDFDSFAKGFHDLSDERDFFHAMPQCEYIKHNDSDRFTVIRFEELESGIGGFIDDNELGTFFDKDSLPKLNGTEHKHYSEYYTPVSKGIVEDMWGSDLAMFDYKFEKMNTGDLWV